MKRCCHCREEKPLDQFKRAKNRPDGLYPECKACCKARYQANREKNLAYSRAYYATHAEEGRNAARRYRIEHPEKAAASHLTYMQSPKYRAWRDANRARINERSAAWQKANREICLAYALRWQAQWRATNPEASKAKRREHSRRRRAAGGEAFRLYMRGIINRWNVANPGMVAAKSRRRRARKLAAVGFFTAQEWETLKARFEHTCLCCGRREPEIVLTADHVVPLTMGGSDGIENIQPLCRPCNSRKGQQTIDYRGTR